jgi:2-polyprenyl-3-methyl-5-hydroxy-6-metoxy-1,4-benzoquinol methylase
MPTPIPESAIHDPQSDIAPPGSTCPLCGHDQARPVVRTDFNLTGATVRPHQVVACLACRMQYLWPRPDAQERSTYYTHDYPAHALRVSNGAEPPSAEQRSLNRRFARIARHRITLMRRALGTSLDGRRVLDIGCGNGAFLIELQRCHNVEAWGLDLPGSPFERLAAIEPRLHLAAGSLGGADLPENYFDVITLWHVLEHDADPVAGLARVRRWLKPGGRVLAEVPNAAGRIAWLCGRDWIGWDAPRHLVHFAPETLRAAADRAGLVDVRIGRAYTLNPVTLSPLLASLAMRQRRRRGKARMKPVAYRCWDGPRGWPLAAVNAVEWLLGGNGLFVSAAAP